MKKTISSPMYIAFALILAGCAGASATQQSQSPPAAGSRPSRIVVYPFAVNPADITLNQSVVQRAYRSVSGEDEGAAQLQMARNTAESVCQEVVSALKEKGWNAICQNRGTPIAGDNLVIIDGEFTDISEGNRLRRTVIGFGAGASTLDASIHMYQRMGGSSHQLLQFATHADSGKMPGAAVMAPVGVAAGAGAGAVVGTNAALGGAKAHTSSIGVLGDKTANQIVDQVEGYCSQHGWIPRAPGGF
ncbi:MAG: DUF4410 domain-containing protein [Candidatus Binataceae bacterium]